MKLFIILFIVIGSIVAITLLVSFALYFRIFYNDVKGTPQALEPLKGDLYVPFEEKSRSLIKASMELPYKLVSIEPKKNRKLYARFYFTKENAPMAIMVHGYKSVGIKDFSGGIQELLSRGHNVLIVDHYAHNLSSGKTITFGVKEKDDVLEWINFVNNKYNNPEIYLYGISMGAATVLMDSGMPLPKNVKGIIADCPYVSVKQEIKDTVNKMGLPFAPVYPFIYLSALIFAGFNMKNGEVASYVKNSKIPILIIHGNTDDIVPIDGTRKLANSFQDKITFLEVEGAPHGMSYFVDHDRYSDALDSFLKSIDK